MMKVIIIAAGLGSRLRPLTDKTPKTLLDVGGRSILDSQIDAYKNEKIRDINIITGYRAEAFNTRPENIIKNNEYKDNNILESLFFASHKLTGDCIITYSDIIFKPYVVSKLIQDNSNISIVVDTDWKKSYINRTMHPYSEAEKVSYHDTILKRAGKDIETDDADGEFIGMLKLNNKGCEIFKEYYEIAKERYSEKKFYSAITFKKSYITDFLNFLISNKIDINYVEINGDWMEIDTIEDYRKAQQFFDKL